MTSNCSADQMLRVVRRIIDEGFNRGDLTVADQVCGVSFENRVSVLPVPKGPEGLNGHIVNARKGFPDLKLTIEHTFAADNYVCVLWRTSGTHRGEFMGLEPTNKHQSVNLLGFFEFDEDAKLVSFGANWESLSMVDQVGALTSVTHEKG